MFIRYIKLSEIPTIYFEPNSSYICFVFMFSSVMYCLYLVFICDFLFKTNLATPYPTISPAQYSVMNLTAYNYKFNV